MLQVQQLFGENVANAARYSSPSAAAASAVWPKPRFPGNHSLLAKA